MAAGIGTCSDWIKSVATSSISDLWVYCQSESDISRGLTCHFVDRYVWKSIRHSTCHSSFQICPAVTCYQFLCQVWVSSIPVFSYTTWALRFPKMINILSCLRTLSLIFCRSMTSSSPFFPWAWFVMCVKYHHTLITVKFQRKCTNLLRNDFLQLLIAFRFIITATTWWCSYQACLSKSQ